MWKYYFQGTIGEMPSWLCFEIAHASDKRECYVIEIARMRGKILEIIVEEKAQAQQLELVGVE